MSGIYGPSGAESAPRIDRARRVKPIQRAAAPAPVTPNRELDRAEISAQARAMASLNDLPAVRQERVDAAKQMVEEASFDLDSMFSKAMNKMLLEEFGA